MRSMPVVVVSPVIQGLGSLTRSLIDEAVSPLPESRLNEALTLAIGLRPVGPREAVLDVQLPAGGGKVAGTERRAVVGQQALDGDAQGLVIGDRIVQELDSAGLGLVRQHLGVADAGM